MSTVGRDSAGMHLLPPYLSITAGPDLGRPVPVPAGSGTGSVEIAVHGRWSRGFRARVSAATSGCCAGSPAGIGHDLGERGDGDGTVLG